MSGIGVIIKPLSGWRSWLQGLDVRLETVVLDCRTVSYTDLKTELASLHSQQLRILLDDSQWPEWSFHIKCLGYPVSLVFSGNHEFPDSTTPCLTSARQLQQLALSRPSTPEIILLPGETSGICGETAGFVLIQQALHLFPHAKISYQSTCGPQMASTLLRCGIDCVLLGDQLFLLPDYPLSSDLKRRISRAPRGTLRRFSTKTDVGTATLNVCPLNPKEWRPSDLAPLIAHAQSNLASIVLHTDDRLSPMSEGILVSREWSLKGWSCSDLIRHYQWIASVPPQEQPTISLGRSAMSSWLGTRLPLVQGPMTRVSDVPEFASAVANAGAMPVIAAAMLPAERLRPIMLRTADLCSDSAWGVGLLAFRPQADLQPQIDEVIQARPSLIVLAGGHHAQLHQFGDLSDRVFIHSPTPELFSLQLNEGCRRFILEGRECGGHTGPCSSLALWEGCLKILSEQSIEVQNETSILFAGGIHGPLATHLIEQLLRAFDLSDLCHGILVGTLTLFSNEAVDTGAISPVFQNVLLGCTDTALLETGPGHQSRCAVTPFTNEFLHERNRALDEHLNGSQLSSRLDNLILGRLRIATKGLQRNGDKLVAVSQDDQLRDGMYMVGEVAALQTTIEPLRSLFDKLFSVIPTNVAEQNTPEPAANYEPIAITGMAVALPGASSLAAYWSLIVRQECQIKVVPEERWPNDLYYSTEASATKINSRWGTFIDPIVIDLAPYPLTPAQVGVTETTQILALDLVSQALNIAGTSSLSVEERERSAVIFASSGGVGELGQAYTIQTALSSDPQRFSSWLEYLPEWSNSSFPGLLSNVAAGRVSNAFDLSGTNMMVDAACASSLAAVDVAVAKLRSGECDRVIVGSTDNLQGPFPYFCFSQSGALSPQGKSRPFCIDSDGIVIGEGCAVLVLQRLDSALRNGSEIYAVIDSIGSSSDGKGRSLTAPSHRGQILALDRAFKASDRHPSELRYYEAHGTGTPVGDRSEITALTRFLSSHGVPQQNCAVGSVKALIGHTKATAGLAGLIKAVLSLQYGALPGHQHIRETLSELSGQGPVYIPATTSPWPSHNGERLAAVSAFGFGGTNFTLLVSDRHRRSLNTDLARVQIPPVASNLHILALPLNTSDPVNSLNDYRRKLSDWLDKLSGVNSSINSQFLIAPWLPRYSPLWDTTALLALDPTGNDCFDLFQDLEQTLNGDSSTELTYISRSKLDSSATPPVVLLFPGQGSIYPSMGSISMISSPLVRQAIDFLQKYHPDPALITRTIGSSTSPHDQNQFWRPSVSQVMLMLYQLSSLDYLSRLGLRPNAVIGHSLGDYLSLYAAGAFSLEILVKLVVNRSIYLERSLDSVPPEEQGGMLVVKAPLDLCHQRLKDFPELVVANYNSPNQVVVSGPLESLRQLRSALDDLSIEAISLDLPAFHHPSLHSVASSFAEILQSVTFKPLNNGCHVLVSTCPTKELIHPTDIYHALSDHLCAQVNFVQSVSCITSKLPDAIFIDLGPRQTGSRLLQANGVSPERILRMDDLAEPYSQPVRVAFSLFKHGIQLDEAALVSMFGLSSRKLSANTSKTSLPYLVNGHGAVPLDGRPIPPSPLVPSLSPKMSEAEIVPMPQSGSDKLLEVYAEYQKTMRMFLDSQDQVFAAITGSQHVSQPIQTQTSHNQPTSATSSPNPLVASFPPLPTNAINSQQQIPLVEPDPADPAEIALDSPVQNGASVFSSEESTKNFILDVLVERTGYPPELLDLNAHLESDLGIDSIKQVEILGVLIESLPVPPTDQQLQNIRAVAREKQTIQDLSTFMLSLAEGKV